MFELLTGSTPFEGRTFTAQLLAKVMEQAPRLREVRPELDLPDGLHALVAELLERDAAARPRSAHAVAERMTALLEAVSLPSLVRGVDAAAAAAQPPAFPSTEPMLVPSTLDNWWAPPKAALLGEVRPVARAPRWQRARASALLVSALLVSVGVLVSAGVLGWERWTRPGSDGDAITLRSGSTPHGLNSNEPPSRSAGLGTEHVLASAAGTAREKEAAPSASTSASKSSGPAAGGTDQGAPRPRRAPKRGRTANERAAHPRPVSEQLAPNVSSARADGMQLPPAALATAPWEPGDGPRAERSLSAVESATAAEPFGAIPPAERDEIIAALLERRQFARSRAIREYREGLIANSELEARLSEIDREFEEKAR